MAAANNHGTRLRQMLTEECQAYGGGCSELAAGALSVVFRGPRTVLKITKVRDHMERMFWENKRAFFRYVESLSARDRSVLATYFVLPMHWKEVEDLNGATLVHTVEPYVEGFVTVRSYLDSITADQVAGHNALVTELVDIVLRVLDDVYNVFSINHCDTHIDNIMVRVAPSTRRVLAVKLIDYDWVSYAHLPAQGALKHPVGGLVADRVRGVAPPNVIEWANAMLPHMPGGYLSPTVDKFVFLNSLRNTYRNLPDLSGFEAVVSNQLQQHMKAIADASIAAYARFGPAPSVELRSHSAASASRASTGSNNGPSRTRSIQSRSGSVAQPSVFDGRSLSAAFSNSARSRSSRNSGAQSASQNRTSVSSGRQSSRNNSGAQSASQNRTSVSSGRQSSRNSGGQSASQNRTSVSSGRQSNSNSDAAHSHVNNAGQSRARNNHSSATTSGQSRSKRGRSQLSRASNNTGNTADSRSKRMRRSQSAALERAPSSGGTKAMSVSYGVVSRNSGAAGGSGLARQRSVTSRPHSRASSAR